MLVSKKKYLELEKRVADLERQVQSQLRKSFIPEDGDSVNCKSENACHDESKNIFI